MARATGGKLELVFTTPLRTVWKDILQRLAAQANKAFSKAAYSAIREMRGPIGAAIIRSPEVASLQGGRLAGELGLPKPLQRFAPKVIVAAVVNSIGARTIKVRQAGANLVGGLTVTVQPADFRNLLGLPISPIKYQSKKQKKMVSLDWLDWLLYRGDKIIVQNYRVEAGPFGRSGLAKMKGKQGSMWRVDPAYSGTVDDNFVTRALDDPLARHDILVVLDRVINQYWAGS